MEDLIKTVLIYALPVIFAITLHEAAHGYIALKRGDNTAQMLGRVSVNPVVHIDWLGTVLLPLILYISTQGQFVFGYAKPVPVRMERLHSPKRDMVWVALAGPGANFLMALAWMALWVILRIAGVEERFFLEMCRAGVLTNAVMFAFNLFPVPPLDGGRVLVGLLPGRWAMALARVEPWGFFIVMALVVVGVVNALWMQPIMTLVIAVLRLLLSPLTALIA